MIWLTLLHLTLFKLSSFTLCRARRLTGHVVVHSGLILLRAEVLLDLLLLNQHGLLVGLFLLDESLLHFHLVTGLVIPVALDESLPQLGVRNILEVLLEVFHLALLLIFCQCTFPGAVCRDEVVLVLTATLSSVACEISDHLLVEDWSGRLI